jgi:DNA repair protein RecN (Recombination protein N)
MLLRLQIRNYAIIDELGIDFDAGLNIITGETGAGKSILMGALGLVLGNRADTSVLYEGGEKCFVEATFSSKDNPALKKVMGELELDEEDSLLLRREIAPSGKSRSFVNDTPVTLQDLRRVASLLVDLHRQFDTLSLGDDHFQIQVLDALAAHQHTMEAYQQAYQLWRKADNEFKKLKDQQESNAREMDYTRFLFNELEEVDLQPDELELLENEVNLLNNAEAVKSGLAAVSFALDESDPSVVQQVKQLANTLSQTGAQLPGLNELNDRLHSVHIELQDIARELSKVNDRVSLDPERLEIANERLSMGYKLLKKHSVRTTHELLDLQKGLGEKLMQFDNIDELLARKEKEAAAHFLEAKKLAANLSAGRKKVIKTLENCTNEYLAQMGMPNARLKVVCEPLKETAGHISLQAHGTDEVQMLFDANKTGRFEPIEKVASGGELSRLMLAIKAQVARSIQLPALIFDEIDTGISGEAARQVGLLMKQLSANHQLIAITHQPQIAAKADAHYFVYKQDTNGAVKTRLRRLDEAQRVEAIARMVGGEALTDSARKIAREMVETA